MRPSPVRLAVVEREPSNRYGIQCVQAEGKDRMDFYDGSAALNECATGDLGLPAARSPCPTTEQAVRAMIAAPGADPDREGLLQTPARVPRAWRQWFAGYATDRSEKRRVGNGGGSPVTYSWSSVH